MKSTEHERNNCLSVCNCRGFGTEEKRLIPFDFGIRTAWGAMKAVDGVIRNQRRAAINRVGVFDQKKVTV